MIKEEILMTKEKEKYMEDKGFIFWGNRKSKTLLFHSLKDSEITVTWHGAIVADNLQSIFSPIGKCTKLATNAFTFCSL